VRKAEDLPPIDTEAIEGFLHRIAIGGQGLALRDEDRKKARELVGLLPEIGRALAGRKAPSIVDAASGSGWVAIVALALARPDARAIAIERDPKKAARARGLAARAGVASLEVRTADLEDAAVWPREPDLVIALHACGAASDLVIERAAFASARRILVAPCCVASTLPLAELAARKADALHLPRAGLVRRRFVESFVLGARLLTLESLGYETEAVAFVGETVTPYNVLLRGRRGRDTSRIARARDELAMLTRS
jgi:hypothetical protein